MPNRNPISRYANNMNVSNTSAHPRHVFQRGVPIGSLCDDLLETIFDFHVTWTYSERIKNAKESLKLTHVCGWWREVALASPRLWCNIEVCQPRLTQEFLKRRGSSGPISFVSSPGEHLPSLQDFERLLRSANRMRQLDVALMPADMRFLILRLGPYFGDILSMRLIQTSAGGPAQELHMDYGLSSLRQLSLDGVTVRWNTSFNLTALVLCRLSGSKAPSMAELQLIFKNNPRLERVSLDDVALQPSVTPFQVDELPRLRLLRLSLPPSWIWRIIARLLIPPSARIEIRMWHDNDQIPSIFPVHDGRLHHFLTITSTLSIRSRRIMVRPSESHPFSDRDVLLVIEAPQNICVKILPTISKVFDLFRLTTLELDFMHPDFLYPEAAEESTAVTRRFLASLFNLVTLRVCQALADILAPLLGDSIWFPSVIAPRLTCLSFGDPQQMWWDFPTAMNGDPMGGWLEPVARGLHARHALMRTKLEKLEFIGVGHINRDPVSLLLPFVHNIVNSVACPVSSSCTVCSQGPNFRAGW